MNPVVALLVAIAGGLILFLPRRFAILPFILVAPLIPLGQLVAIGPLHFYVGRILLVFVWIRVLARREYRSLKPSRIDTLIIFQFVCGMLAYIILRGTMAAFINRLGWIYDGLSIYFLMRWLIRDVKTWERVLAGLAVLCAAISVGMLNEARTGTNVFSVFGGVSEITELRDGKLRCEGPFEHPILAGTFGANLIVLFISLGWMTRRKRLIQMFGIIGASIILVTSASSTPVVSCAVGLIALAAFTFRTQMRLIRWGAVLSLVSLHLIMNNPVWAIIAKFKIFGGSTGYYRFWLLDNFIRRFSEWYLLGTESTAKWGYGLWDVCNMYVRIGVDGGLLALILFLSVIVCCYRTIGRGVQRMKVAGLRKQKCIWALGAALTGHLAAFFGINYFDQNVVPWYMLLAVIAGSHEIFASAQDDKDGKKLPLARRDVLSLPANTSL